MGQNVLLLGQSNAGKSFFLKQLLSVVKPKRLVVISNTSARQYQQDGMDLKHYTFLPVLIMTFQYLQTIQLYIQSDYQLTRMRQL